MSSRRCSEFREFYATTQPAVAGYCLALTGDPAVADELAQEALAPGSYEVVPELRGDDGTQVPAAAGLVTVTAG